MTKFKKIFLIAIALIIFSFSTCLAIDESQLLNNTSNNIDSSITNETDNSSYTDSNIDDSAYNSQLASSLVSENEDNLSTRVSSVSSISDNSTITNILLM